MFWTLYEKDLVRFLEGLAELPDDCPDVRKIREEVRDLADSYGRYYPDKFRTVWERLREELDGENMRGTPG